MSARTPVTKHQVSAWPPGPRFITTAGRTRSSRVFRRDYDSRASALRAASQVHRLHPAASIELGSFTLEGIFWVQRECVTVQFCLDCGARLDWQDGGMYWCPRCGSEWHDDHFREESRA